MICMHLSFVAGVSYVPAACLLKLQLPLMMHSTNHASATATTYINKPPPKAGQHMKLRTHTSHGETVQVQWTEGYFT